MAVIPHSLFKLVRLRREITEALQERDWYAVEAINGQLMAALDQASNSKDRNLGALVKEVEVVVRLYRELIAACESEAQFLTGDC
ncbi:MAG: hypothetical protein AseanaTS_14510 [Candidatus Pelagadaptatus aseana]|uniref:hypothetical protein n=1 Tax=Candidatus Pelagadaptatus aseana TaxID=3120508 RepID=UPI0039B1FD71